MNAYKSHLSLRLLCLLRLVSFPQGGHCCPRQGLSEGRVGDPTLDHRERLAILMVDVRLLSTLLQEAGCQRLQSIHHLRIEVNRWQSQEELQGIQFLLLPRQSWPLSHTLSRLEQSNRRKRELISLSSAHRSRTFVDNAFHKTLFRSVSSSLLRNLNNFLYTGTASQSPLLAVQSSTEDSSALASRNI
jgi:hypothetical protein